MKNIPQQRNWISRIGLRGAAAWLALATLAVGSVTIHSAQAQTFTTLLSFECRWGQPARGASTGHRRGFCRDNLSWRVDGTACSGSGCGTVFTITPSGTLTTLYSFCSQSGCTDGAQPYGTLIQATDGNIYGTTNTGGTNGDGTFFQITPDGALTTLHSFDYKAGYYACVGRLARDSSSSYGKVIATGKLPAG